MPHARMRSLSTAGRAGFAIACLALAPLTAGCGGERELDAEQAVEELNQGGARLELGASLQTAAEGPEVRVISFDDGSGGASPEAASGREPGSGALVVLDDVEAAEAEFRRCEGAVSFICFRAANTVLRFEGLSPEEQARITASLQALDEG